MNASDTPISISSTNGIQPSELYERDEEKGASDQAPTFEAQNAENISDEESLYESLSKSVSIFNEKFIPSFSQHYSFDYNPFLSTSIRGVKILPNGWIVLWSSTELEIFNLINGELIETISNCDPYWTIGLLDHPRSKNRTEACWPFEIHAVHFFSESNTLAITGGDCSGTFNHRAYYAIKLYKITGDKKLTYVNQVFPYTRGNGIRSVAFISNNSLIVGTDEGIGIISDAGEIIARLNEPAKNIVVSEDSWIASSNESNDLVKLYKFSPSPSAKITFQKNLKSSKSICGQLAFLRKNYLAAACYNYGFFYNSDFSINVWNVETAQLLYDISTKYQIYQLLALPNGWLCSLDNSAENNVKIWNTENKNLELAFSALNPRTHGRQISLTEDGHLVIQQLKTIIFFDVAITKNTNTIPYANYIFSSILKFKLFKIHNLLKIHPEKVLLSQHELTDNEIPMIIRLLKYSYSITELDLSYNKFTLLGIKLIANLLNSSTSIQNLNVAGNQIDQCGVDYFSKAIRTSKNSTLESINFTNNNIDCNPAELHELERNFKYSPSLTTVDLSQNFLTEQCDSLFSEEKSEEPSFIYSFFKTKSKVIKSQINPEHSLSTTKWLVCFSCPKNDQHAFIILEGMRENGQLFLEKYEITTRAKTIGIATIRSGHLSPNEYKGENFYFQCFDIDDVQGNRLRRSVANANGNTINYSVFFGSTKGGVNCGEWCIQQLAKVGVKVNTTFIPTPRNIARGRTF